MFRSPRCVSLTVVAATVALSAPVLAEPALFDSMMEALGGRSAVADLRSLAVEASCSGPGGRFNTRVDSVRGVSTYFRQASSDGTTEIWTTPERTWSLAADGSQRDQPAGVGSFVRGHEFHLQVLEIETRFSQHRLAGKEQLNGQAARRIEMVDAAGHPAVVWLSTATHLPLALETNPPGAAGPIRVTFEDWAPFAGVQLFRSFRLMEGSEREFRYDYVRIAANPDGGLEAPPDPARARAAIATILERDRQAHLQTDAAMLGTHIADELVEVADGAFQTRTRQDVVEMFSTIFDGATYHEWKDVEPPVIRLSSDLSMAWVARRVGAAREDLRDGKPVRSEYTSAYTATYEKLEGRWWMTSVTSTFAPPTPS